MVMVFSVIYCQLCQTNVCINYYDLPDDIGLCRSTASASGSDEGITSLGTQSTSGLDEGMTEKCEKRLMDRILGCFGNKGRN